MLYISLNCWGATSFWVSTSVWESLLNAKKLDFSSCSCMSLTWVSCAYGGQNTQQPSLLSSLAWFCLCPASVIEYSVLSISLWQINAIWKWLFNIFCLSNWREKTFCCPYQTCVSFWCCRINAPGEQTGRFIWSSSTITFTKYCRQSVLIS